MSTLLVVFVCLAGHGSSLRTYVVGFRGISSLAALLAVFHGPATSVLSLSIDSLCQTGKKSLTTGRENPMTNIRTIEIHPNGSVVTKTLPTESLGDTLCTTIDCRVFDVVALDGGIDLFVGDEGLIDGSVLNLCATVLPTSLVEQSRYSVSSSLRASTTRAPHWGSVTIK
jgi:hypothetical protein